MPKVVREYKEEARNRIIDTALATFSERGYHETTMDDIAKRLGVSKGALYLYFQSKEDLFKGCSEKAPQALGEILRSSFTEYPDPVEGASAFFEKMQARFASNSGLGYEIFSEAPRNPALRRTLRENYDGYVRVLTRFLEELKSRGLLDKTTDLRALSRALIALWNGMETLLTVGFPAAEVKRAWLEALKTMFAGFSEK